MGFEKYAPAVAEVNAQLPNAVVVASEGAIAVLIFSEDISDDEIQKIARLFERISKEYSHAEEALNALNNIKRTSQVYAVIVTESRIHYGYVSAEALSLLEELVKKANKGVVLTKDILALIKFLTPPLPPSLSPLVEKLKGIKHVAPAFENGKLIINLFSITVKADPENLTATATIEDMRDYCWLEMLMDILGEFGFQVEITE